MTLLKSSTTITHEPRQRTIEILPSGVGDFPVLHFLLVFDFISHFYQAVGMIISLGYILSHYNI
jgi:hypothetical protein